MLHSVNEGQMYKKNKNIENVPFFAWKMFWVTACFFYQTFLISADALKTPL